MTTKPKTKKPIAIALLLFLTVFIGISSVQMHKALVGFDTWVSHEDHRLPNVRLVREECRWAVIDRFIELQPVDNADAYIFGDSQLFARGATNEQMFYRHWLDEDAVVINFAFLAARIGDQSKIAEALESKGYKAKTSLLNINLTHYAQLDDLDKNGRPAKNNTLIFLPTRPSATQRLYQNRYVCAFKMRREFARGSLRTPRYRKLLTNFNYIKLRPHYVSFDPKNFDAHVPQHLGIFARMSDRPVLVSAPMAYDQFNYYKFDTAYLEIFSNKFNETCSALDGKTTCLDLTRSMASEGFTDLIHFNAKGHRLFGERLKTELAN